MKKFICAIFISLFIATSTFAQTIKVEAITAFSTDAPPKTITFRAIDEIQLTPSIKISSGDVINAKLIDIKDPKRLKRDATFKIELKTLTTSNGKTIKIKENNIAKFVPEHKIDKKEIAKKAALTVGNHFVEGLNAGYRAIEGAVKSEESGFINRTKSAGINVYENSALSLASKGNEIVINEGDIFGLKIHSNDEIEEIKTEIEPNYTYELK